MHNPGRNTVTGYFNIELLDLNLMSFHKIHNMLAVERVAVFVEKNSDLPAINLAAAPGNELCNCLDVQLRAVLGDVFGNHPTVYAGTISANEVVYKIHNQKT